MRGLLFYNDFPTVVYQLLPYLKKEWSENCSLRYLFGGLTDTAQTEN